MVIVGRHINGITINPLEYLLDDEGNEMLFDSEESAEEYLRLAGMTEDEIYWFVFEEVVQG
jgi:hypothetical protein